MMIHIHNPFRYDPDTRAFETETDDDLARLLDFIDGTVMGDALGRDNDAWDAYEAAYTLTTGDHETGYTIDPRRTAQERTGDVSEQTNAKATVAYRLNFILGQALTWKENQENKRLTIEAFPDSASVTTPVLAFNVKGRGTAALTLWINHRHDDLAHLMSDTADTGREEYQKADKTR